LLEPDAREHCDHVALLHRIALANAQLLDHDG
jgi:hypothetical protein